MKSLELADAFEFVRNGASIKQSENSGGIPITRIETIWNSNIDANRFGYADIENSDGYKNHLLVEGDILMSHINSPKHLGKCALYRGEPDTLIHGMNLLNLRPLDNVTVPEYVFYYFSSNFFKQNIARISNQSVNQASFSSGNLKKLKIPLPPLPEQKKIAAILDAADSLRQKDQQLIDHYTALSQSLFLDMFGDPVTNPMGWEFKQLSNYLALITYGLTVRPKYIDSGIPLISAKEIRSGRIDFESAQNIEDSSFDALTEKGKPIRNDILFSKTGSIGHCAIVENDRKFAITQNAARLTFKDNINPIYALNYLRHPYFQNTSKRFAKGNAVKDLQLGDMKKFKFLNPPIDLQNQFAERIEAIENQKQQAQASLQKSNDLFNSLLQRAFKGELTRDMAA